MRKNLLKLVNSEKVDMLVCMTDGCKSILSQAQLDLVFWANPEIIDKIRRLKEKNKNVAPRKYCHNLQCNSDLDAEIWREEELTCKNCGWQTC
jgi:hypothetical protein